MTVFLFPRAKLRKKNGFCNFDFTFFVKKLTKKGDEMSSFPLFIAIKSLYYREIAPLGHTSAHVPHSVQTSGSIE